MRDWVMETWTILPNNHQWEHRIAGSRVGDLATNLPWNVNSNAGWNAYPGCRWRYLAPMEYER